MSGHAGTTVYMLQTFEIICTLFTQILLNITMYDSFSPFFFSFCIQYDTGSNSEDSDEMQNKVAFYQDLHCHLHELKT